MFHLLQRFRSRLGLGVLRVSTGSQAWRHNFTKFFHRLSFGRVRETTSVFTRKEWLYVFVRGVHGERDGTVRS